MTEHNHRRGSRAKELGDRLGRVHSRGGDFRGWSRMHGKKTAGRDYAFSSASDLSLFADRAFGSKSVGNDFTNGRRGMAKAVRGAKKYVRTRRRFHENALTRELARFANAG